MIKRKSERKIIISEDKIFKRDKLKQKHDGLLCSGKRLYFLLKKTIDRRNNIVLNIASKGKNQKLYSQRIFR